MWYKDEKVLLDLTVLPEELHSHHDFSFMGHCLLSRSDTTIVVRHVAWGSLWETSCVADFSNWFCRGRIQLGGNYERIFHDILLVISADPQRGIKSPNLLALLPRIWGGSKGTFIRWFTIIFTWAVSSYIRIFWVLHMLVFNAKTVWLAKGTKLDEHSDLKTLQKLLAVQSSSRWRIDWSEMKMDKEKIFTSKETMEN